MNTQDELTSIRQRAEAATEGPWDYGTGYSEDGERQATTKADKSEFLALSLNDTDSPLWLVDNTEVIPAVTGDGPKAKANAEFIAHARTDIPRLLGALDAVLALADVADKRAASNYGEGKLRYEAGDQDARAFQALGLCQTQVAHELRAAINDALEAGK